MSTPVPDGTTPATPAPADPAAVSPAIDPASQPVPTALPPVPPDAPIAVAPKKMGKKKKEQHMLESRGLIVPLMKEVDVLHDEAYNVLLSDPEVYDPEAADKLLVLVDDYRKAVKRLIKAHPASKARKSGKDRSAKSGKDASAPKPTGFKAAWNALFPAPPKTGSK